MDKTALVERYIEDGKRLLTALDGAELDIRAAFWFYLADSERWRFIVASPLVDAKGPTEMYLRIQTVLKKIFPPLGMALDDISAVGSTDDRVQLLRKAVKTRNGPGVRFTGNVINNVYIDDVYIYRMR